MGGGVLRVIAAALAALGLLSVAIFGGETPLWAQGTERDGVGIALDDLSSYPTHLTVDGFTVQLSNLTAAEEYQVTVSSDSDNLGIGGCDTLSKTETVTGVETQELRFVVYACTVGEATVTAEVRRTGASSAEASVSQGLMVEAVPENAIGARGERVPAPAPGAVPKAGTPGSVPNTYFSHKYLTSVRANWGIPSDGGTPLTGYGLRFWLASAPEPRPDQALVRGLHPQHYTYEGLAPETTYRWRIHACNGTDSCGYWTVPEVEVETAGPPKKPHTISVVDKEATSARVKWSPEADTGGPDVSLTGFGIRWRVKGTSWPSQAQGVVNRNKRSHVMSGLTKNTTYEVSLQSCNGDNSCSAWTSPLEFRTPGMLPAPPAPTNLAAGTATRTSVPLTWDALTGAAKYRVENRPGDSGAWTEHDDDIGGTSHTVDGLSCGTSHQFRVTAYGNGTTYAAAWGTASAVLTASTSASGCTLPSPPAPGNLTAGTVTDSSVPLSWNAVAHATKYRVEYRASGTSGWTTDDDRLTVMSHTVDELICETAYEFGVSAFGDGTTHLAQWSAPATTSATTGACVPGMISVPGPVTGVRFPEADLSDTSFKVTWTAPSSNGGAAITKYEVNWVAGQTNETEIVTGPSGSSPPTETTIDADVKPATAYVVKVRACNGPSRCSPWPTDGRVVTTRPSQVQDLNVQAGDGQLTVSWSALESNLGNLPATQSGARSNPRFVNPSARLLYKVQYRQATIRAWPADDNYTAGRITSLLRTSFSGLANRVTFQARSRGLIDLTGLGPELQLPTYVAGAWSAIDSATTTDNKLASPEVTARPLPGRVIRLNWTSVPNANNYFIKKIVGGYTTHLPSVPSSETLITTIELGEDLVGAGYPAVTYTVTADDTNDTFDSSEPRSVTIVDNPILSINGTARDSNGRLVAEVKLPKITGASSYTIYYRRLPGDHTSLFWTVQSPFERAPMEGDPWTDVPVTPPQNPDPHFTVEIGADDIDASRTDIYGVYLTYRIGSGQYVSAREAYVWVSARAVVDDERIATIPLTNMLNDQSYANPRTYAYRVCFSLFDRTDSNNNIPASADLDELKAQWTKMVEHAFSQWQTATDDLIIMDRLDENDVKSDGQLIYECGDFDKAIEKGAELFADRMAPGPLNEGEMIRLCHELNQLEPLHYFTNAQAADASANEVVVVNFKSNYITHFRRAAIFSEISVDLGMAGCVFRGIGGTFCAVPSGEYPGKGRLTDVFIPSAADDPSSSTPSFDPLPDPPVGVSFNECLGNDIAEVYVVKIMMIMLCDHYHYSRYIVG